MDSTSLLELLNRKKIYKVYNYSVNDKSSYYEHRVFEYFDNNGIMVGFINKEDYNISVNNNIVVYINKNGDIIYEVEYIGSRYSLFHKGLCCVSAGPGFYKVIDTSGEYIIDEKFEIDNNSLNSRAFPKILGDIRALVVRQSGLYGILNYDGKILGDGIVYDRVEYPKSTDNTFKVIKDGSYWFLDQHGNDITGSKYPVSSNFSNGIAIVKLGNKFSFINKKGEFINNFKYSKVKNFSELGYGYGIRKGKPKYINKVGEEFDTLSIDIL